MIRDFLTKFPLPFQPESRSRPVIRSRWIETADERCPIACTWFPVAESPKEQDDEPGLAWPVFLPMRWRTGPLSSIRNLLEPQNSISGFREA